MKRTEKDLHISPFCHNFAAKYKKNSSQMMQLSKKMLIFALSFVNSIRRHRGERISFDPSENLENSKYAGEKSESCFSCSSIYTACSHVESAHVNTCRCELISFLRIRVFQDLQTKDVKKAHTLCVEWNINNSNKRI